MLYLHVRLKVSLTRGDDAAKGAGYPEEEVFLARLGATRGASPGIFG
jgi:hypothetical protein